tara:strand:- start:847 stop:1629 length:783 start_codon:yes stop_codon:yes gene_type:complete
MTPMPLRLLIAALLVAPSTAAQPQLLISVLDQTGAPVTDLTTAGVSLDHDGAPLEVVSITALPTTVQVVALFEGLAVTQRQLNSALTQFISALDADSVVDMQSVDGPLDAAIMQAVGDLHDRGATHPVVIMLGQASEMARSDFQSSQVRGRRQAADLTGDLDSVRDALAAHGIPLYGISVTDRPLENLTALAIGSGGRFEIIGSPADFGDTLSGIGAELGHRYLLTYRAANATAVPRVRVNQSDTVARASHYRPTHKLPR